MVPLLMGISHDSILRLDIETKLPKETPFELSKVTKHGATDKILKVQFSRGKHFTVQTSEGDKISKLIDGYCAALVQKTTKKTIEKLEQVKEDKAKKISSAPGQILNRAMAGLSSTESLGIIDDPKWKEEKTREAALGIEKGMKNAKLNLAQMIRMMGQGENVNKDELEKTMGDLAEDLIRMANLANMHNALNEKSKTKDNLTRLCADVDDIFRSIGDIFQNNQLGVEVRFTKNVIKITRCLAQDRLHYSCTKSG